MLKIFCVVFVLILGFFAGGQLGKIAPVLVYLQEQRGYSLVYLGWLTSLIGFFVAAIALPTALFVKRFGPRGSLNLGTALMFGGALLLVIWDGAGPALAARGVEAAGYVLVVIAAPAALNAIAPARLKAPALALWGGFVPIGYALANIQAGIVTPLYGVDGFFMSMALGIGVTALFVAICMSRLTVEEEEPNDSDRAISGFGLPSQVYLLSAGFGLYVVLSISFFTFLPAFFSEWERPLILSAAAIALCVPLGNFLAGVLVGGPLRHRTMQAAIIAFVVCGLAGALTYQMASAAVMLGAAVVNAVAAGVVASLIFASIPRLAENGVSASLVIGVIAQAGGIGTLLGPPLAAFAIELFEWTGLAALIAAVSFGGALCVLAAARAENPRRS